MSSSQFQLPDLLIADLYRQQLVIISEDAPLKNETKASVEIKPQKEWFLGNNKKNITLLVNDVEATYLKDVSLQLLSAMLNACNLNMEDVALINFHKNPISYAQIKIGLKPKQIILFNVTTNQIQLPFMIPLFQVQPYDDCSFLLAPALDQMLGSDQNAKLEKSKLWLCLKKMFPI